MPSQWHGNVFHRFELLNERVVLFNAIWGQADSDDVLSWSSRTIGCRYGGDGGGYALFRNADENDIATRRGHRCGLNVGVRSLEDRDASSEVSDLIDAGSHVLSKQTRRVNKTRTGVDL